MHYMIYAQDAPESSEKRRSARPAHLKRLQILKDQNRLILAGPLLHEDTDQPSLSDFKGSLIIAEFENLEEAKRWAAADPYATAEVYANITVQPLKVTL